MALVQLSDQELMVLLKQDDEQAFAVLYARYRPKVYRYALRITHSGETAEEIVQTVMLKVWTQRASLDPSRELRHWISRVAANASIDQLKQVARERSLARAVWSQMQHQAVYSEDAYVLKEYLALIEAAVRSLPPQQQRIYRLSREQYLTYDQIAEELHISSNTVRNHMTAALDNIRKHLAGQSLAAVPPLVVFLLFPGKL